MEYMVYILKCADGTYYTGITTDPARRLREHNRGTAAKYTRPAARRPVAMVYQERLSGRSAALRREYAVKQMSRAEKEGLIQSGSRDQLSFG